MSTLMTCGIPLRQHFTMRGGDAKTAKYLLGHKDLMTTMKIYTKMSEEKSDPILTSLLTILKVLNHAGVSFVRQMYKWS